MEDKLVKDRLNKQHHRVEQEIKKYDEILKRNRNMRNQYEHKRKDIYRHANNENYNNSSMIEKSMDDMTAGTAKGPTRFGPFSRVVSAAATRVLVDGPPEPMMRPVRSFFTSFSSSPESAMACCMAT